MTKRTDTRVAVATVVDRYGRTTALDMYEGAHPVDTSDGVVTIDQGPGRPQHIYPLDLLHKVMVEDIA